MSYQDPELRAPVLAAEEAYVGSLLWLDQQAAAEAAQWLHTGDICSPATALVHSLVIELCAHRVSPDPVAVLSLAISSEAVVGAQRIHDLTRTLWRLYDHRATIPAQVRFYACAALDQAIRRRTVEMATRLAQVAAHADPDELERLTRAEQADIDRLRDRLRALTHTTPKVAAAA
jgi:replicative DNA helicase